MNTTTRDKLLALADELPTNSAWQKRLIAIAATLPPDHSVDANKMVPAQTGTGIDSAGFAKVFGIGRDQILVKRDGGDEGPELQVYFSPPGLGVCCLAVKFTDDDDGEQKADEAFVKFDEAAARKYVEPAIASLTISDDEDEA